MRKTLIPHQAVSLYTTPLMSIHFYSRIDCHPLALLLLGVVGRRLRRNLEDGRAEQNSAVIQLALDILAGDENVGLASGGSGNGGGGRVAW